MPEYLKLEDLEIYRISRRLSELAFEIFSGMAKRDQIIIGEQFLRAVDSIGANIAEAYGRYSYLDRIRILYFSRGSYFESRKHWLELMKDRKVISPSQYAVFCANSVEFEKKLNAYIKAIYTTKNKSLE